MRKGFSRPSGLVLVAALLLPAGASALSVSAAQSGGIYASGAYQNAPTFQNYFVGYGTTPGLPRTAERRSFFVFDVPALPPGGHYAAATLKLRLPFGGLVFGKGPGTPGVDPIADDSFESFALGWLDVPSAVVLSPSLGAAEAAVLFGLMAASPVAAPTSFTPGMVLPPSGDGGPPIVSIALDGAGLAALNLKAGGSIVLSGWMPSWSEDLRLSPSPPPLFFEASELIFGLTDVHVLAVLTPKLELAVAVVPELPTAGLLMAGLAVVVGRRDGFRRRVPAPAAPAPARHLRR
jgi:hypothetical protein